MHLAVATAMLARVVIFATERFATDEDTIATLVVLHTSAAAAFTTGYYLGGPTHVMMIPFAAYNAFQGMSLLLASKSSSWLFKVGRRIGASQHLA